LPKQENSLSTWRTGFLFLGGERPRLKIQREENSKNEKILCIGAGSAVNAPVGSGGSFCANACRSPTYKVSGQHAGIHSGSVNRVVQCSDAAAGNNANGFVVGTFTGSNKPEQERAAAGGPAGGA
jgi:hypothetical protein